MAIRMTVLKTRRPLQQLFGATGALVSNHWGSDFALHAGLRLVAAVLYLTCLSGCFHAVRGGPESVLDKQFVVGDGKSNAYSDLTMRELDTAADGNARNVVIEQRMMMIDKAYGSYVRDLQREQTRGNMLSDLADLALGVAGTLANGTAAKTNYAAASTLLAGSTSAINRRAFFEQSTTALVAAMDAFRSAIRLRILESSKQPKAGYPPQEVYYDLTSYEFASTLLGGLSYIQVSAEKQKERTEAEIDHSIRDIFPLVGNQRAVKKCLTLALAPSDARTVESLSKAADAMKPPVVITDGASEQEIAELLQVRVRHSQPEDLGAIEKAFVGAGLVTTCQEE